MKRYQCLYDFLEKEGFSRSNVKKITSYYFNGKEKELPLYMQRSLYHWIVTEKLKGQYNETNYN